jgi:hypothetical protein
MQVGDLVKYRGMPVCWGVITQTGTGENRTQIECLWCDGDLSWAYKKMVEVIKCK